MANGGRIDYTIGFNVDKTGLNELQKEMSKLQQSQPKDLLSKNFGEKSKTYQQATKDLEEAKKAAEQVGIALQKSFNARLNMPNVQTFTNEINKSYGSVTNLFNALNKGGIQGQKVAGKLASSFLTAGTSIKKTETIIDKMGTTLMNTLKWTFSSSLINRFTGAIQQAVGYVEHLDRSLNDIRIVTKKSADEMETFGQQANKAAQSLGKATTDYTEAALIYYQKAANVTGQATKTVSEQLTAVWNGFRVNAEQTEEYVDKLAAVAAMSASNLEELSTGMSKVASAASNLGVDIDQLTAQISTIVSVTRQAPESVGTALKTIYARISDLKLGESDEDGLGLGDVSGGLKKLGIEVLDSEGELRDLGTVIEEVAGKWNTWTQAQQAAVAQLMAGKRQYNNLVSLFDNWDMYTNAIETSRNATGELQKQQDIYMESTEAHIQQLKTQWEDMYDSLIDPDTIKTFADGFKNILKFATDFVDVIGGGSGVFTHLIGLFTTLFSGKIASSINEVIQRFTDNKLVKTLLDANVEFAKAASSSDGMAKAIGDAYGKWGNYAESMTNEQREDMMQRTQLIGKIKEQQLAEEELQRKTEVARDAQQQATAKYEAELENAANKIKEFEANKAASGGKDNSSRYADGEALAKGWDKDGSQIRKIQKDVQELIGNARDAEKAITRILKLTQQKTQKDGSLSFLDENDLKSWTKKAQIAIGTAKNELENLKNAGKINEEDYNRLTALFGSDDIKGNWKEIAQGLEEVKVAAKQTGDEFEEVQQTLDGSGQKVDDMRQKTQELTEEEQKHAKAAEETKKAYKQQNEALDEQGKVYKRQNRIQGITQLVGGITSVNNSLRTTGNLVTEIFSGKASIGSVISGITSTAMTSLMAVSQLNQGLGKISSKLGEVFSKGKLGLILGIAAGIMAVVKAVMALRQAEFEKEAENAKNLAEASREAAEAAREHKKAVDELKTSYDALDKTSVTYRDDLRKLLIDHGEFAKAAQVATSSLEDLDKMMKQVQEDANNKVIDSSAEQIERLKNAISTDINAKVLSESERDLENGINTIDLGDSSDTASIAQILQDNGIDIVTDSGHINLQQFVNAMVENEAELRKALQENGSAAARRLLEIMGSEQEMLSTTAEALTAKQEAQLSNIENNIDIKSNGTFEEYDKAFTELKQKANEIFKDDKKAEEWAKKRIAESGAVGTAYAGLTDEVKGIVKGLNKQLTAEQLNYLNDHIDIYKAYGEKDAQAFLDGAQALIDGQAKSGLLVPITIGLSKDELKDEDIKALFANGPLGNLTEGEFRLFDAQKQKRELRKYFDELVAEQESYNKETLADSINNLDTQRQQIEQHYTELTGLAEKYNVDKQHLDVMANEDYQKNLDSQLALNREKYEKNVQEIANLRQQLESGKIKSADGTTYNATEKDKENLQNEINAIIKENGELNKQQSLMQKKLELGQKIAEYQNQNDVKAQEIIDQYEATAKEIDKEIASIAAHSKELATSVQDVEDLEKLHKAGEITDTDYSERYMQLDRAQDIEGLDVEQLENYTKYIQEIAKSSDELADSLEEDGDAADKVAKSIMKMNKGVEELSSNFENWSDMLQHSNKDSQEYLDALSGMRKAMSQLLDISEDYVSSNFLNENLELIGKAAEGDAEAIDNLRTALAKDVVMNLKLNDESFRDDLLSKVQSWQAELDSRNLEVGATFDDASMIAAMNKMIADVGLTVDQVNALFDSMGFEANFAEQDTEMTGYTTLTTKHHTTTAKTLDPDTGQWSWTETEWVEQEPIEGTTKAPAFALTTDGSAPKINSITKKATGSMNNASKRNSGGAKKSSSSGGGSSAKQPNKENPLEREEDIYREINTELKNIESTLKRIQTIDEHSWGASQKKALQEEQKLLDKQIATLERKQKMQVGDLSTRRKQLEDVGVNFSADGSVMTNAEGVLNQLYAGYNQMVQRYNNMSAAEQEAYKAQMDTEKNRIDAIEKAIGEYESGYSDLQGTLDELQSKHYEQIETNVREFNHDIDVHLELSDAKKEWNDFWEEVVEDVDDNDFGKKIAGSMKQLENLVGLGGPGSGIVGELTNHLTETVDMVQAQLAAASSGGAGLFEDDTAASHDNLVKYRDELMSALRDAKGEVDEIRENYFSMLDEAQEKMDKQKKGWENIRKQLEHNANLIKLIDGENAYDALNKQYELRHKNNLETIETNKQSAEWWKQRMENAKRVLETTDKNSSKWKDASKEYEVASENYIKNLDDFNQSVEQALEDINEQIELLTNQTFDKLEKDLTNGLGFDVLEEEWKLINDYANSYFDNVERYLNMEEYTNILNDAANAVGLSAENQQKLNEFRDQELDKLRSLNKLTAYDIEESKARLEIMKAQMALEDAQRNKSNLRLRRDSQGNYNYQYVENADAVDEANQGVFSAQKAWYEIVKKQNLQLTEDIMGLRKAYYDYEEKANQAWQDHNIEAYNKYKELASRTFDQIELKQDASEKNKRDLYEGTAQYFAEVDNANIIPQNEATVRTLIDNWASGGEDSFIGAVTLATNRLSEINEEYGRKTKEVLEKAGIDFAGLRNNGLDPTINTLQTLVDTNEDFKDMLDETSDSLAEQERNLRNAEDAYNDLKDAAVQAIEAANNALNQLATTAVSATSQVTAAIEAAKQASAITYNTSVPTTSPSGSGGSGSGSGGYNSSATSSNSQSGQYILTAYTDTGFTVTGYPKTFNSEFDMKKQARLIARNYSISMQKPNGDIALVNKHSHPTSQAREYAIQAFRSGGYTGSWNDDSGRWAVLHQKELVLNASDTKNMLSAVEILRSLPIEALAKSIIASSSNIASSLAGGVNVSGITGGVTNNDSKNMVINADFSGVSSADEIYKAFLSLENYGIQQSYSVIPNIN